VQLSTANTAEDGPDTATTNETDGGDNAWFKPALKRTQSVREFFGFCLHGFAMLRYNSAVYTAVL
jgi:hypothetical protein